MKRILVAVLVLCAMPAARGQVPKAPAVVTARCAICHGEKGEAVSEDFPRLAAQHEAYLAKQLHDFKSGDREGIMRRMARGLSDEDIAAVASYFAAQTAPAPAVALSEIGAAGRYIFLHGNPYSGVPACKACHGESAHGTPQLPRLAGQHVSYLERQLKEFTQRKRTNDNEVMHAVAQKLTELEMRAVAEYLSSLP